MERDGDLLLNVSCSQSRNGIPTIRKLPARMPDGSRIESSRALTKKINKTHQPALSSGKVFIPRHKLPVLDEFGLTKPSDHVGYEKPQRMLPSIQDGDLHAPSSGKQRIPSELHLNDHHATSHKTTSDRVPPPPPPKSRVTSDSNKNNTKHPDSIEQSRPKSILKNGTQESGQVAESHKDKRKRRKRKVKEQEPIIIPKEVQAVAGGLPPSFPKHRIKKFTEEYQMKKRQREENGELEEPEKKKRRSFVPGLNPRKREKSANLFTDMTLEDLEDVHPYLIQNLEQNMGIKSLTKIQSMVMPSLLKTRFESKRYDFMINSGVGTGKILSYVVPIVNNLALIEPKIKRTDGVFALVLLPTRELAAKISEIFVKLCRTFLWVVPGLLTGGERKKSEKARLRKGLNILITTPGRLIDHMEHSEKMDFSKLRFCVMADAHRLIDPERAEVSKNIAIILRKRLPQNCVRCVVTATLTKKLEKLCEIFISNPEVIDAFKDFD